MDWKTNYLKLKPVNASIQIISLTGEIFILGLDQSEIDSIKTLNEYQHILTLNVTNSSWSPTDIRTVWPSSIPVNIKSALNVKVIHSEQELRQENKCNG